MDSALVPAAKVRACAGKEKRKGGTDGARIEGGNRRTRRNGGRKVEGGKDGRTDCKGGVEEGRTNGPTGDRSVRGQCGRTDGAVPAEDVEAVGDGSEAMEGAGDGRCPGEEGGEVGPGGDRGVVEDHVVVVGCG